MSADLRAVTLNGEVNAIFNMDHVTDIGPQTDAHGALCVIVRYTNGNMSTLYGLTMAATAAELGVSP